MKIILKISILVFVLAIMSGAVYAQKGSGAGDGPGTGQGNGDQMRVQDPAVHEDGTGMGNQVQNKNKVNTQNMGEDSQLNVNTKNSESSGFGMDGSGDKGSSKRSDNARQHMSAVSKYVEDLLSDEETTGGLGKQVSEFAKQQKSAQNQIGKTLDEIEGKKGLAKKLFGPDYKALKEMKQLMQQNQVRIQQLQQLKDQTQNEGEETQIQEMIQAMVDQNTALEDQVQAEENLTSIFGWLVKLIN